MTRSSSSRLQNWAELLACTTAAGQVACSSKHRTCLACTLLNLQRWLPRQYRLLLCAFCCSLLPFAACLSLLAFCCCLSPSAACLLLLRFASGCSPFRYQLKRHCIPGCGRYYKAAKLAEALQREHHYTVDEKQKSVLLTEQGYEDAEDVLEVWVVLGSVHLHIQSPAGTALRRAMLSMKYRYWCPKRLTSEYLFPRSSQ